MPLQSMPVWRRVLYAFGMPGVLISERIVVMMLLYFYLPPRGSELVPQVSTRVFLGGLTVFGLAMFIGRVFDSVADPLVAHASDRSASRFGRRRVFMMWGIVPMIALPLLGFWPPGGPGSPVNAVWLTTILALYFVFYTVYFAPYLALVPELAWNERERVRLSWMMAVFAAPYVGAFGAIWTLLYEGVRAHGVDATGAMRWVAIGLGVYAFSCCAWPLLAVDERRFARGSTTTLGLRAAIRETLASSACRRYLLAQMAFVLAVGLVQPAQVYYAVSILGRSEGYTASLLVPSVFAAMLGFAILPALTRKLGPKRVMAWSVLIFGLAAFPLGAMVPDVEGGPHDAANRWIAMSSFGVMGLPFAAFMVLPPVMVGQLVDADASRTGAQRSAMFFGVQGFLTKWVYGVAAAILALLLAGLDGRIDQARGVLWVGPLTGVVSLLSAVAFWRYPEQEVLAAGQRDPPVSAT